MPTTDPMKRDAEAARADLMAIYERYGRTDDIAVERGGDRLVSARHAELDRINDVFAQCKLLDEPLPEFVEWSDATIFSFAYPNRRPSFS